MRIDGLAITFCLGLGVADLLTINLVLSPRLAGEPTLAPAALALAVVPEPSEKARVAERPVAPAEVAARPAAETPPTLVAVQPSAPAAAAPTAQPTVTEVPKSEARTETETETEQGQGQGQGPLAIIYFEKSLARLDTASRARLDQLAADLRRHPRWKIHVSGHTDPTGPDEWNRRLSVIRARVVAARLERAGIDVQRIETEGRAALDANGPAETCRRAQVAMLRGDE
jgi:outer membrane protein OmpA-like peptidoglycan-associated protein